MPLDSYDPCPGGNGKKIKFCGCKEMIADLSKAIDALEGEQRIAGMTQIDSLLAKHPDKACLLTLKTRALFQLEKFDEAGEVCTSFREMHPENPIALAQCAIAELAGEDADFTKAIEFVHEAFDHSGDSIRVDVYQALELLATRLLQAGNAVAARAHCYLLANIDGLENENALRYIAQIDASPSLPLVFKKHPEYDAPPGDAPWAEEYVQVVSTLSGGWPRAAEQLKALGEKHPDAAPIHKTRAKLCMWTNQGREAGEAWRQYAQTSGVDEEDAVEAEMMAQLLAPAEDAETIDELAVVCAISDAEKVQERLLSDRRVAESNVPPERFSGEDELPPKAVFVLLDRAMPTDADDLKIDSIPSEVGELALFGRQTDRDARLEFHTWRTDAFEDYLASLKEIIGDQIGEVEEKVLDQAPRQLVESNLRWRLPMGASRETHDRLVQEQQRHLWLNMWPTRNNISLGNKTPAEAAADPSMHRALLALLTRVASDSEQRRIDKSIFHELRQQLNVPSVEPIDPEGVNVGRLSPVRLSRLVVEKLSDDSLLIAFQRATGYGAMAAAQQLGAEIVKRDSLDETVHKDRIYRVLASNAANVDEALAFLIEGRNIAAEKGRALGDFLLDEIPIRMARGEGNQMIQLIRRVQSRHIKEPGVAERLYNLLLQMGMITPDGNFAEMPSAEPEPEAASAAAAEPDSGKLWTPDSDKPSSDQPSKLWTPGSD